MTESLWQDVDRYLGALLIPPDAALDGAIESSIAAGLPAIAVSPMQGKLLHLLAKLQGAKRILEIGTLGGYSTIWMARALPAGGKLITLEYEAKHAEVATANIARARLAHVVEVRFGRAIDTLPALARDGVGPFDMIFIDADKQSIPEYFAWSISLSRPGSLIIVDNVIRAGNVVDANSSDPNILGVRQFNEMLASEKRVSATTIQTVGLKGYDGFTLAIVNGT